ncbi:MAG: transcription elongation factor GreA [Candidatus Gracilibacteria bacterium]|nr:transcription elongation factor GreA [Candidatus Gracilibacteria bacterium]
MSNKIYLTKEGLSKLQEELENLKTTRRLEIAAKLKEAISFGDLSENSEYEDARNEQAHVELRILDLEEQLKNYELIDESADKKNRVSMGSIVEIKNLETKELETFKIVGATESDILAELPTISNESPVGSALLGKKQGDKVEVKAMSGLYTYEIVNIK